MSIWINSPCGSRPQNAIKVKRIESINWLTMVLALFLSQRNLSCGKRFFQKQKKQLDNYISTAFVFIVNDLAPQVGLEPTTYGLTVRRSNQLSY
jgi:hypothetical protein